MDDLLTELRGQFLSEYASLDASDADSAVHVPWRLSYSSVQANATSVRACCMEWLLRYLDEMHCPHPMAEFLCSTVLGKMADVELTPFSYATAVQEGEETAETPVLKEDDILDGMKVCQYALTACRKACWEVAQGRLSVPSLANDAWLWNVDTQAIRNRRRKMEDRHVALPYLEMLSESAIPCTSLYAVFDGHRGADAAEFAASHYPAILLRNANFEQDLPKAMSEALREVDEQFLQYASPKNIRAGCTALVACIRDGRLHSAWLGDSQLMMSQAGKAELITAPHSASRQDEQERIDSLGGIVIQASGSWRVSGQLAVSRAIGDSDLKKYLTSDADTLSMEIAADMDFIVLGCDGVWDVTNVTLDELRLAVEKCRNGSSLLIGAAKSLVDLARTGSEDNITAVVIDLKAHVGPR